MKSYVLLAVLCSISSTAFGWGELGVLHSPDSIKFKDSNVLSQSLLKEIYSAVMGYTIETTSTWNGLYIQDPFSYAEAVVHVEIPGVKSLKSSVLKGIHRIPLDLDENEFDVWYQVKQRVLEHGAQENNTLFRVELAKGLETLEPYPQFLEGINVQLNDYYGLNPDVEEEREFLEELKLFNAFIDKVKAGTIVLDGSQDVFWIVFKGFAGIVDANGADSKVAIKAGDLLAKALLRLSSAMSKMYEGRVYVDFLTGQTSLKRRIRAAGDPAKTVTNLAEDYDEDYPVVFNIILWFMVAFIFTLLAVSVFIGTMDPGRDSIIYRMTSTRMKKDN